MNLIVAVVLHEGTWEVSENNQYREDVSIVLAVVGELSNILNASAPPTVRRWRWSNTELPRDIKAGGHGSCSCSCTDICGRGSSRSEPSGRDSRPRTGESASGDGEILSLALSRS